MYWLSVAWITKKKIKPVLWINDVTKKITVTFKEIVQIIDIPFEICTVNIICVHTTDNPLTQIWK